MTKDSFNKKNIDSATYAFMRELLEELLQEDPVMAENLRDWIKKKWVRITSSGKIGGACGTSKKQSNPDRCLPQAKAKSMTQSQRAATARKKKEGGSKGKQFVSNTKKGKVTTETKSAPAGHYFTKSGNLVKGRLTKDAQERGARKSDPKDKQRSKVPPVTQYSETSNPQDGKAAPYGSGYRPIKFTAEEIQAAVSEILAERKKKKKKSAGKNKPGKATATHKADGTKKDACALKADKVYGMATSAYKSLGMSKCRKVGAANWAAGKKKK